MVYMQRKKNGIRQGRSCSEHLFILTTIIRNRKLQGKSTFTAFLDVEKAFDRVDRELLLFKLLNLGIKGHIYQNIKAIYKEVICCINVNNMILIGFKHIVVLSRVIHNHQLCLTYS